jgi:hypothetical protein
MNLDQAKLSWDQILANAANPEFPRDVLDAEIQNLHSQANELSEREYTVFAEYARLKSLEFFRQLGFDIPNTKPQQGGSSTIWRQIEGEL